MKNSQLAKLPINQAHRYNLLSVEVKQLLQEWINENISGNELQMFKYNSYKLKYMFERRHGIYIENGAFKGAMLAAGYIVEDTRRINWKFKKGEN